ncbi:MAG TPA: hypothetical protein VFG23_13770 [Polyangia bacterium]|nr:hypothetical protein [Polyangia bacterium]
MTHAVTVNLATMTSAYGVAFSNVQNLIASNYNDVLTLAGGGTLTGGAGADTPGRTLPRRDARCFREVDAALLLDPARNWRATPSPLAGIA